MSDTFHRSNKAIPHNQTNRPQSKIPGSAPPVRIFQSDWMEAFTLISLRTFLIFYFIFWSIVGTATWYYSKSPVCETLYFLLGLPIWVLSEYLIHRFIFHIKSNNKKIQHLIYVFHGNHHIQPNHPYRTLMPIIVTFPIGILIWTIFIEINGIPSGSALFWGFLTGYICYDSLHYATHNFQMKNSPFSLWQKHHLLHHYMTEEHNYSISMPWLDTLFFTNYKK